MSRYVATKQLRTSIQEQGRTFRWVAEQVGLSDSHFNRILSGERWISKGHADSISTILSQSFFVLWKVAEDTEKVEAA